MRVEGQKCRRADNMIFGIEQGAAEKRFWNGRAPILFGGLWSAGACSRFCGIDNSAQMMDWETGAQPRMQRCATPYALANNLQNVGAPTIPKTEYWNLR
jgi:hypothetical protein